MRQPCWNESFAKWLCVSSPAALQYSYYRHCRANQLEIMTPLIKRDFFSVYWTDLCWTSVKVVASGYGGYWFCTWVYVFDFSLPWILDNHMQMSKKKRWKYLPNQTDSKHFVQLSVTTQLENQTLLWRHWAETRLQRLPGAVRDRNNFAAIHYMLVHSFYIVVAVVCSNCVILAVFFVTKTQQIIHKTK